MQLATLQEYPQKNAISSLSVITSQCKGCPQHNSCLSSELNNQELITYNSIAKQSIKLNRGEYLYRSGDIFDTIFMIRSGSLKTSIIDEEGREQILSFSMQGDIVGLDGLFLNSHVTETKALEPSYICGISVRQYLNLAAQTPVLIKNLLNKMSARIIEEEEHSLMLGTKNADQRLASFLLNLAKHNSEHEFPNHDLTLHMSRRDIGNYLSAAVETVSRIFSRLQEQKLIKVHGKHIHIMDRQGLERNTF
jgi:CRP/FNR family transcriptional regulator